jgi:hypothetical protein
MASRKKAWMAHKLAIMARQRKRDPIAVTKNRSGHTMQMADRITAETSAMVQAWHGVTTVVPAGHELAQVGKQRRTFDSRTFGNGTRRVVGGYTYYSLWACDDQLIRS